ncbi:MAG: hypothetical protein D6749_00785 [Chloroflexota bacterium]|nr:MAG: hypothetical protein D6749_00785 [Chloroflexota bacterium]
MQRISRQEVLNIAFAQVLHAENIVTAPEIILKADGRRHLPDVIVEYRFLQLVIEGEVADQPEADAKAYQAARRRLEEGIGHIAVGVIYPAALRDVPFTRLSREFHSLRLRYAVLTPSRLAPNFNEGALSDFRDALENAYQVLLREDEVSEAVAIIEAAVEEFAAFAARFQARLPEIAAALEIPYQPKPSRRRKPAPEAEEDASEAETHTQVRSEQEHFAGVSRIAGLVVLNALIFQEILSQHKQSVKNLRQALAERPLLTTLAQHWQNIIVEIDYYPIFHLAARVLEKLPTSPEVVELFEKLARSAERIVEKRAALQHDLMGRVYHRLLSQAKFLGTYYTSVPAAVLLLKLALNPKRWQVDWSDFDQVRQFRVADLACGTGTLLMAAADAITSNHVNVSATKGVSSHRSALQRALAEEIIYGYDVLASAVHLTASTLALRAPEQTFDRMNLFALPLGGENMQLGSLEFANAFQIVLQQDMFGSALQVAGSGDEVVYQAPLPKLDLCVMNPPFVRSGGDNLLFGSLPDSLRSRMQQRLQRLIQQRNLSASITAGLGALFVAVAHPYIKEGGRIALVLPKALLSGIAWEKTRQLINQHYRLEYLVVSHDPEKWNFSESTDLSEVLLIARKITNDESGMPEGERPELYDIPKRSNGTPSIFTLRRNPLGKEHFPGMIAINLRRNFLNVLEALTVAKEVVYRDHPNLLDGQGGTIISYGETEMAETFLVPYQVASEDWMLPCAFAQVELARAAYHLLRGEVWVPGARRRSPIRLCALSELGTLGPDSRDVHDGFELSRVRTVYPAFWGHTATEVVSIAQAPNCYLRPRPHAQPKRPLRLADDLFPRAGRLLLGARMWLNTQRLFAVRVSEPVLSNVWWSFQLKELNEQHEKALAVWLNSTLHTIIVLTKRVETRGAWVKFNKPTLEALPVLDMSLLTKRQLSKLAEAYDRLSHEMLLPFPEMENDPTRAAIDAALSEALGLPDLRGLRILLGQEPVICLKQL